MSYIYQNENPIKRNTNDCVIRAIATAMSRPWEDVYMDICRQGLLLFDMPSSNSTWEMYLLEHGYKKSLLPNSCPHCYTLNEFCEDFPYGTYIVATGSHVVAVVDGNYFDTSNSGNEIVTYYFYKEEDFL